MTNPFLYSKKAITHIKVIIYLTCCFMSLTDQQSQFLRVFVRIYIYFYAGDKWQP